MHFDFETHSGSTALIDAGGAAYSYSDLATHVRALSDHLQARCVVLCLTKNTIGGIVGYLASIATRAVPILMDYQTTQSALSRIVSIYRPRFVWTPVALAGAFSGYATKFQSNGFSLIESRAPEEIKLFDNLGVLLTTSGSTGSPKLVRLSYGNLLSNTHSIVEYLRLDAGNRTISTLPYSYSFGLSILNTFLHVGASIVLTEASLVQREFWDAMRQHQVSSLSGVPYTFEMLNRIRFLAMDLPNLKTLTQAGGKLPVELCKKFAEAARERNLRFFAMYGATEASARMSYLPPEHAIAKAGSIGIAIPGGAFELRDESGKVSHPPHAGQLIYQGPNVALGYAENIADLAKGDEFGGILMTGDMASCDEDGHYFITGRIKRFIKLFGIRTNLDDVERLIQDEFPDLEVACTGEDNRLLVHVLDNSACIPVRDHLVNTLRVTLSAIDVRHITDIPRSTAGKILYAEL